LSEFYDTDLVDMPHAAITPTIWTAVWLATSIITACISSLKQFLDAFTAGLAGAAIGEHLDAEHSFTRSKGNSQLATKLGLTRSGRAIVTGTSRSEGTQNHENGQLQSRKVQQKRDEDTSESVKGLTDGSDGVITRTTDWWVKYEDVEMENLDHDHRSTSSGTDTGALPRVK
jgi:hypothetical protein